METNTLNLWHLTPGIPATQRDVPTPVIRLSSRNLMTLLIQISFQFPSSAVPAWHLISAPNGDSTAIYIYIYTYSMVFLNVLT